MKGLQKIHTKPIQLLYTFSLAAVVFYVYYLVMKIFPGMSEVPACLIGGSLSPENIIFSGLLSVLTALTLAGLFRLYLMRKSLTRSLKTSPLLGLGFLVGFFTIFCTLCTIPVLSIFGLGISLGFFSTYNLLFKMLSFLLLLASLFLLDKQLRTCETCPITPRRS